jgi:hypothetical protein
LFGLENHIIVSKEEGKPTYYPPAIATMGGDIKGQIDQIVLEIDMIGR